MPESKSGALPLGDSPKNSPKNLVVLRPQRMPVQATRHEATHVRRQVRQGLARVTFAVKCAKNTRPGSGHAGIAVSAQPFKMTGHLRVTPAHHPLKILTALTHSKRRS